MITLTFTVEVEVDEERWSTKYDLGPRLTVEEDATLYLPQLLHEGLARQKQSGAVRGVLVTHTSTREGCAVPGCVWVRDHSNPQHMNARGELFTP